MVLMFILDIQTSVLFEGLQVLEKLKWKLAMNSNSNSE